MGSLFILIWTENAPPLSVQIKIKRDLTLGNVSFYLNLDRHQYLAQSRVYQCAKTSKSRILNLILVKYNILTIKAMFFYNFLLYFEAFLSKKSSKAYILKMGACRANLRPNLTPYSEPHNLKC